MISPSVARFLVLALALACVFSVQGCPKCAGPTAAFTGTPRAGVAPLVVQFTDLSVPGSSPITAWLWDLGDGGTSQLANPGHTYQQAGTYSIALTVTTKDGTDTHQETGYIVVSSAEGEGEGEGEPTGLVEIPDPLSGDNPRFPVPAAGVPAAGQSVVDPDFGTAQTRVVAAERLRHEYSRLDPFNADQSLILLLSIADGVWRVYRTAQVPYDQAGNLVTTVDMEEPRWDPTNPDLLWGVRDFSVVTVSVGAKQVTVRKDFAADATIGPVLTAHPDLYHITMRDEGESSTDKRYWAFLIQGSSDDYRVRYLFTWDRQQDQVLGLYTLPASESLIDWAGMSPKGTWVLIGGDWDNGGDLNGLVMANRELTQFHQLDYGTAHADVGLDSEGNEVIVMQGIRTDYVDLIPLELATTPILDTGGSYDGTNRTPLLRLYYDAESPLGFNSGVHISCNFPGYCVVSTYTEPGVPEQNWLDRKIVVVTLDRQHPRAFYLAQVHGTRGEYWEETQAAMASDGSRVVWTTNWNQHVGEERVWLMQVTLPPGWTNMP